MKPPLARWMACTALAGLIVFSVSCRQQSALPPEAVATVGDAVITVDALQQALARRGWHNPTAEQKAAVLEDLIRFEALHAQARKTGYLQQPEVQNAIKHLVAARYREKLATNQSALPETAAAGLPTYYQAHPDAFRVPEQLQVALVFLPLSSKAVPEKRREAEQRAHELRHLAETECASLAHFGPVAQTHSAHQASRYRGGELGGLTREQAAGSFSPEVVEAMFALLQPSELSPVVSASDGFYLLKLVGAGPPRCVRWPRSRRPSLSSGSANGPRARGGAVCPPESRPAHPGQRGVWPGSNRPARPNPLPRPPCPHVELIATHPMKATTLLSATGRMLSLLAVTGRPPACRCPPRPPRRPSRSSLVGTRYT